ncbi:RNA methyltransferase [Nannocystis sp. SCPEA4]|uniref:THUMP domain-containing class I SAM-dependent RNA methyltransferase n=1 Tax=Nannocystis sp. SCPEA4 TaxID=2996787 RepID=UPI0022702EEE|nr:RNA methyltransferase [Nannocystis sp. SCPEA4]MCY1055855.1 RNA methyltransferase [Nannocystis sp. SCPEA4]
MRELFAVALPGLEPLVAAELDELGLGPARVVPGGVGFRGDWAALIAANLHLRTATRVLVRLAEFPATNFAVLSRRLVDIAWEDLFPPHAPLRLAVRATAHKSRLYHTGAIAERVHLAVAARLGGHVELARPHDDTEDGPEASSSHSTVLLVVRLERDRCTVSVDSSGDPLHRRGYRLATAKAPLRPTLAAALLAAVGWRPGEPLLDPFCGSGTIAIEAALQAHGVPAGALRDFSCARWPALSAAYPALRRAATKLSRAPCPYAPIVASDRDEGAVAAARANAQRAGVDAAIAFSVRPFAACEPFSARGLLLTNPPYGIRVGRTRTLRDLYAHIGHVLRDRFPAWRTALLCPPDLRVTVGVDLRPVLSTRTGGLAVELALAEEARAADVRPRG